MAEEGIVKIQYLVRLCVVLVVGATIIAAPVTVSSKATEKTPNVQELQQKGTSYAPVDLKEDITAVIARMKAAKPAVMKRQMDLLKDRYDLANRSAKDVTMSSGKPIQEGVRVALPKGMSWEKLQAMSQEEIREKDAFPLGFFPLPHPNHPEGGMVFPQFHIEEIQKQEGRDLTRFDLDFDLPAHLLPEFPPPIYLTTRPDLGDVSQGKLVTIDNYYEFFKGILNPKQLEGLRLLVTTFPQQQFNQTEDRRTVVQAVASPASSVMRTATRMRVRTWPEMSARRSFVIALIRQHYAASTSSDCSARRGR
jgi:cytochrome c peroxidase